jgi:hypothetical protein
MQNIPLGTSKNAQDFFGICLVHKSSHMVLSIIFIENTHKVLLHLSIFYEYQQFFQHRTEADPGF